MYAKIAPNLRLKRIIRLVVEEADACMGHRHAVFIASRRDAGILNGTCINISLKFDVQTQILFKFDAF
jgi:hypothetical protein